MTIEEKYNNPFAYARAMLKPDTDDREASVYVDACVSNWDEIKTRRIEYDKR